MKEKAIRYFKQRYIYNKENSAGKLDGVKWCDIHRKWYIKVWLF